jgi:hypothetical protein
VRRVPKSAADHRAISASDALRAGLAIAVLIAAILALHVAIAGAATEPTAEEPTTEVPVLGSKSFAASFGAGFGRPEPEVIFNGGDPSGEVTDIHWTSWGGLIAIGYGRNPIFKPGGGYYRKPARIELRATKLGTCGTRAAYTRLEARVPKHPGGKLGKWMLWAGAKSICEPPH